MKNILYSILFLFTIISCAKNAELKQNTATNTEINSETNTTKVWTRWWWMGSAVDSTNIRQNLTDLHEAGIGGVEITPIYGVKGEEENFLQHLSPAWNNMLNYTIHVADSLGMGVDMVLGTGWPYGGPHVTEEFSASKLVVHQTDVAANESPPPELLQAVSGCDPAQHTNIRATCKTKSKPILNKTE